MRRPKLSEKDAAGRLTSIPGIVDADATIPSRSSGVPRLVAKGFNTGFFDMVELRIAKKPMTHRIMKNVRPVQRRFSIEVAKVERYFLFVLLQKRKRFINESDV